MIQGYRVLSIGRRSGWVVVLTGDCDVVVFVVVNREDDVGRRIRTRRRGNL